jgi:hypothetical protein
MYAVTGIVDRQAPLFYPRSFDSFSDYLVQYFFLVALVGTLIALVCLHVLQGGRYGWVGTAGSAVAFYGHLLFVNVTTEQILAGTSVGPGVQQIGSWAILVGPVTVGFATLFARVLPLWSGVLLLIGGVLAHLSHSIYWWPLLGVVLGILWALVGYALLSSGDVSARRPARVS